MFGARILFDHIFGHEGLQRAVHGGLRQTGRSGNLRDARPSRWGLRQQTDDAEGPLKAANT
jgi:hypothetical protein